MYTQKIQNLKELLIIVKKKVILFYDWLKVIVLKIFDSIITGSLLNNHFHFLFLSWIFCLLFYLGFFLIGKNPYSIFIPFSLYEVLTIDNRTEAILHLSDGEGSFVTTKRKVLFHKDDFNKNVMALLSELGELPYLSNQGNKNVESSYSVSLKKLPNIANTIISLWYQEDKSNLILDINLSGMEVELEAIKIYDPHKNLSQDDEDEEPKEAEKTVDNKINNNQKKLTILSSAFFAAEKTIFDNFPFLKSIEYRVNGKIADYPGLEYKLSEKKVRQ